MPSLQRQLTLGLSLTLAALLLILWWLAAGLMENLAEELIQARLEHDSETLLQAVQITAEGGVAMNPERVPVIYQRPLSGHYFVLVWGGGQLRSRSLWDDDLPTQPLAAGISMQTRLTGPADQPLLALSQGYLKKGQSLTLLVAEETSALQRLMGRFHIAFGTLTLAIIVASLIAQGLIVRRSLRSLDTLRGELRLLEQGKLSTLSEGVPKEIKPLVQELNRLLTLLEKRLRRSRNGLGNLAHAVKRPINLIRQQLDRDTDPIAPQEIGRHIEEIRLLTERELQRARLVGAPTPGRLFFPRQELPDLIELLKRLHASKETHVELAIHHDAPLAADRDDMLELFGNLLDNAFKWAESRIACRIDGQTITIRDDGPGCASDKLKQISERGVRIDEAIEGHGLGLAIVKDLVNLYDGSMLLENLRPNGFQVTVTLSQVS
jgi:signal transduction histidine kinase